MFLLKLLNFWFFNQNIFIIQDIKNFMHCIFWLTVYKNKGGGGFHLNITRACLHGLQGLGGKHPVSAGEVVKC